MCVLLLRKLHALCSTHIFFRSVSLSRVALKPLITSIEEEEQFFDRSILEVWFFCVLRLVQSALKTEHSRRKKFIKPREEELIRL